MVFSKSALGTRQARSAKALDAILESGDLLLVFAGESIGKPGGHDQTYPFLPHPDYYWLSGLRRASGVMAYSKTEGWKPFVKLVNLEERLWEGTRETAEGESIDTLAEWIKKQKARRIFALGQASAKNTPDGALSSLNDASLKVQEALNRARRIKDSEEIALVERCASAAAKGYLRLEEVLKDGISERHLQLEYEHAVLKAGADSFPYDTLVGSGLNSAVLHATPTTKLLRTGELVLVDAGADIQEYCVDISRTYAVGGTKSSRQKDLYDLVLKSQLSAIEVCKPGVEWHDVHRKAAHVLTAGLKDLGLLRGEVDSLLESGAISMFFPHGVGHMVGLRVRDVGSRLGTTARNCCGVRVRVDMPLEEGFLMTVEPGLYFVAPLLDDPKKRELYRDQIDWNKVESWRDFGGIRIEDNILVTASGPRSLTSAIPK